MKYNQIYGKFSLGTGGWIDSQLFEKGILNIYSKQIIESYIKQVSLDLERMGLKGGLENLSVMDVGTGRQALAFNLLGAKKVTHFDISSTNFKNFSKYVSKKNLPIKTYNLDICQENFNGNKIFDFIYLQGIIQHVKNPYKAIKNLSKASKKNTYLWFYNYQAGPIQHLYAEALRLIIPRNINYKSLIQKLKKYNISSKMIDMVIDDLGCTYRNLIKNNSYKIVLEKFGYRRYFTKDVADQKKGLDLKTKRTACISAYKKTINVKKTTNGGIHDLYHLNHFSPDNFVKNQRRFIYQSKILLDDIINNTNKIKINRENLIDICMPLLTGLALHNDANSFSKNKQKLIEDLTQTKLLLGNISKQ